MQKSTKIFIICISALLCCFRAAAQQLIPGPTRISTLRSSIYNVCDFGAKGDLKLVTTGSITSGTDQLSVTGGFTASDVGKGVIVVGAGVPYTNGGAWAASTAYAENTVVSYGGSYCIPIATSGAASSPYFVYTSWLTVPTTVQALYAVINSVSGGVATLSSSTSSLVAANASTTVSGANVYYGTNDTVAFQAAITAAKNAGGGEVLVPTASYFIQTFQLILPSNIHVYNTDGVVYKPWPLSTDGYGIFCLRGGFGTSGYSVGCSVTGPHWTVDLTGFDPRWYAGQTGWGVHGVTADYAQDWDVEGETYLNGNGGNGVDIAPLSNTYNPIRGVVKNIVYAGGSIGFGAVQVDGCTGLDVEHIQSNAGFALDLEPDDADNGGGVGLGRVVQYVNARDIRLENSLSQALGFYSLNIAGHAEKVQNISASDIYATGGANGMSISYDTVAGSPASVDHIHVSNISVVGGGLLCNLPNNVTFSDVGISNFSVYGSNSYNPSSSHYQPGTFYTAGMTYSNGIVSNGLGDGFDSTYFTGATTPYASGQAVVCNVSITNNGTNGTNSYGVSDSFVPLLKMDAVRVSDNSVTDIVPFPVKSCTLSSSAWGGSSSYESSTVTDSTTAWFASLLPTSNAASTHVSLFMNVSSTANMIPVVAGAVYKFTMFAKAVGAVSAAVIQGGQLRVCNPQVWWYTSSGASNGTMNSAQVFMSKPNSWYQNYVMGVAPANTAYAVLNMQVYSTSANMTSGEQYALVPGQFGPVTSANNPGTVETNYALDIFSGCKAVENDCEFITPKRNFGTGWEVASNPRTPDGMQPVVWQEQLHGLDGVNIVALNTTGLTSAQIDATFSVTPVDGTMIYDPTNNYFLVRANGKWNKTSALTQIS